MGRPEVIGREAELRRGRDWLASLRDAGSELSLVGDAGIGKTTIWRALVDDARDEGMLVAVAQASPAEAKLAYAVLGDLCEALLPWLGVLPPPQRRALGAALLIEEPPEAGQDLRAVAVATLTLVRTVAAEQPVLVAVDDAHWTDPSSRQVLEYVGRRLPPGAGVLLTTRSAPRTATDASRVVVGPLNLSALHHVIRQQLGSAPPRPLLVEIERRSLGSPIVALELARAALEDDGRLGTTSDVDRLVGRRVARLPAVCRDALLRLAASGGAGSSATELDEIALRPAVSAGLVSPGPHGLHFSHPLYAEAVLQSASDDQRRAVHRELADSADSEERRVRHLALAAVAPDDALGALLDHAVERTRRRGAAAEALELAALATSVTPPGPRRTLRELAWAELAFQAGDSAQALHHVEVVTGVADSAVRTRALLLRATMLHDVGSSTSAVDAATEALAAAGDDLVLQIDAHLVLAAVGYDDLDAAARHAAVARELLDRLADPPVELRAKVLRAHAGARLATGFGLDVELYEEAIALEALGPAARIADRASAAFAADLKYADDLDRSRRLFAELRTEATANGDDSSLTYLVSHLPQLELQAGRWGDAERHAVEHLELSEQMGQAAQRIQALYNLGLVHAHRGRIDEARALADETLALSDALPDEHLRSNALLLLGFTALSIGDSPAAAAALQEAVDLRRRLGLREPGTMRGHGDLAEALVGVGRLADAEHVVDELGTAARRAGRRSAQALACRGGSAVEAARGRTGLAIDLATTSVATYDDLGFPFEAARSRLVLGMVERRAKQRGAARADLQAALDGFAQLGAACWVQRAAAELGRVGSGRRAPTELTATELRVALLAAKGMTNREVAGALFMSPKTVEANLARAYRKLGTSSRAELGAKLGNT